MQEVTLKNGLHLRLGRKIGKGSYSTVYECTLVSDSAGPDPKKYACKRIKLFNDTDRCFLEAAILSCISHPHIVRAHSIHLTDQNEMFIIQDLAVGDLSKSTPPWSLIDTKDKETYLKKYMVWIHELVTAIKCLHRERIVHGDIKSENVFLYEDGTTKLGDFSLARKDWIDESDGRDRQISYTCTHRAPEVYAAVHSKQAISWGPEADMWALGCTLYEIIHKTFPFPPPSSENEMETWAYQIEWARSTDHRKNPWGPQTVPDHLLPTGTYPQSHQKTRTYLLSQSSPSPLAAQIDMIIGRCLRIDPNERLTALELLQLPFFSDYDPKQYHFIGLRSHHLNPKDQDAILESLRHIDAKINAPSTIETTFRSMFMKQPVFSTHHREKSVCFAAYDLIVRSTPLFSYYSIQDVVDACWRIASRMCVVSVSTKKLTEEQKRVERDICWTLQFRFLKGVGENV